MRKESDFILFFKRFYLFIRERQREREAEGEAGSTQEADVGLDPWSPGSHRGTRSPVSRITPPAMQVALNRCATGAARVVCS